MRPVHEVLSLRGLMYYYQISEDTTKEQVKQEILKRGTKLHKLFIQ